jgi:hypothetical protein
MKYIWSALLVFLLSHFSSAQNVAINNSGAAANTSAMLDIQSTNKGLLIPRISLSGLTDAATITTPATSLLVYNTNAAISGGVGFYYNSGTSSAPQWTKLATASDILWREQTNYVELTPNKPLYLSTNVGIGITTPAEKLQVDGNIKLGSSQWFSSTNDRVIKFGDGDYVRLGEIGADDAMQLEAKYFWFKPSSSYSGNVGICTAAAPTAKLEVNGNFKLTDGTQGTGKVLTSNTTGVASWSAPAGSIAFKALNAFPLSLGINSSIQLTTSLEDYDISSNFLSSAFTAPATGIYHFDTKADITVNNASTSSYVRFYLSLFVNGSSAEESIQQIHNGSLTYYQTISLNTNIYLAAGDVVTLRYYATANSGAANASADKIVFSGYRVY